MNMKVMWKITLRLVTVLLFIPKLATILPLFGLIGLFGLFHWILKDRFVLPDDEWVITYVQWPS